MEMVLVQRASPPHSLPSKPDPARLLHSVEHKPKTPEPTMAGKSVGSHGTFHVGMAPFVTTVSSPVSLPDGAVGISLNCGIHASRVVGKGGAKIHDLMSRTGATIRVTRSNSVSPMSLPLHLTP